MMGRPGVKKLMRRLQQSGLIPKEPNNYAALKQPAPKMAPAPNPQVTAMSIKRMPFNLLRTQPVARAALKLLATTALAEPGARLVGGTLGLIGPKADRYALHFG